MINQENIQIAISIATIIGMIFLVYNKFTEPDIKAEKKLEIMEKECGLKHKFIDENFLNINMTMQKLKDNDLHTITEELKTVSQNQVKIFTILEERLPRK